MLVHPTQYVGNRTRCHRPASPGTRNVGPSGRGNRGVLNLAPARPLHLTPRRSGRASHCCARSPTTRPTRSLPGAARRAAWLVGGFGPARMALRRLAWSLILCRNKAAVTRPAVRVGLAFAPRVQWFVSCGQLAVVVHGCKPHPGDGTALLVAGVDKQRRSLPVLIYEDANR